MFEEKRDPVRVLLNGDYNTSKEVNDTFYILGHIVHMFCYASGTFLLAGGIQHIFH